MPTVRTAGNLQGLLTTCTTDGGNHNHIFRDFHDASSSSPSSGRWFEEVD